MLNKAKELLRSGSKDDIKDFLIDITTAREKIDYEVGRTELDYDLYRIERFEYYKALKSENKMTEKEIDMESKKDALLKYGEQLLNKKVANHYKENIDQLKSRIVEINTINKELRESGL